MNWRIARRSRWKQTGFFASQPPRIRRGLGSNILLWLLVAAWSVAVAYAQSGAACAAHKALTLDQVLNFLDQKIAEDRILQYVESCNVGFPMNAPTLDKLVQAGASEKVLDTLNRLTAAQLTLADAKAEAAQLQQIVDRLAQSANAERDAALQKLDSDYQSERALAAKISPQSQFEPDVDYNARKQQNQAALAALDRKHEAGRAQLTRQFATQAAEKAAPYRNRIGFLEKTTYPDPRELVFGHYNPNERWLTATLGGEEYRFDSVPPKTGETLFNNWKQVKTLQPFTESADFDRTLTLEAISVPGYSVAARKKRDQLASDTKRAQEIYRHSMSARTFLASHSYDRALAEYQAVLALDAANSEASQQTAAIQALLARRASLSAEQKEAGVWVDSRNQRMWPLKDNATDVSMKAATEYCQALRTGGFSDWRLPTSEELGPLFDSSVTRMTQAHTHTVFTLLDTSTNNITKKVTVPAKAYHIAGNIQLTEVFLWTSEPAKDKGEFLLADFHEGHYAEDLPNDKKDYRVLCMRTYAPPLDAADLPVPNAPLAPPPGTDDASSTTPNSPATNAPADPVHDTSGIYQDFATHRMWPRLDNGSDIDWRQTQQYCRELRLGGYDDWRMPSLQEIESLYDPRVTRVAPKPAVIPKMNSVWLPDGGASPFFYHIAGNIALTSPYVWTSGTDTSRGHPYLKFFRFKEGKWDSGGPEINGMLRALCVRTSESAAANLPTPTPKPNAVPEAGATPTVPPANPSDTDADQFRKSLASCNRGNSINCVDVARRYQFGKGVGSDAGLAREYFKKACEMGNRSGCTYLKYMN